MYQCTWFYTANLILPKDKDIVAAAWNVTADEFYRYEMSEDALALKDMFCFIRTIEGEGRLEKTDGTKIFLPKKFLYNNQKKQNKGISQRTENMEILLGGFCMPFTYENKNRKSIYS